MRPFLALALLVACGADDEEPKTTDSQPVVDTGPTETDPSGTDTTTPDPTEPTEPDDTGTEPVEPDPTAWVFEMGALPLDFEVVLTDDAIADLEEFPREWTEGSFVHAGTIYSPVGIRLKGNGSFQDIHNKPSIKVDFNRYDEDGEFHGLNALVLNNMTNDPAYVSEAVGYWAFNQRGIPSSRVNYATVSINGEARGIYATLENINKSFLKRWYDDNDGTLYEMFDVDFMDGDEEFFELEEGDDAIATLEAISAVVEQIDAGDWNQLSALIDRQAFLNYWATCIAVGHYDAYPFSFPGDDVFLYIDPADGRMDFIPHGLDEAMRDQTRPPDLVFGKLGLACLADFDCPNELAVATWEAHDQLRDAGLMKRFQDAGYVAQQYTPSFNSPTADGIRQGLINAETFLQGREAFITEHFGPR